MTFGTARIGGLSSTAITFSGSVKPFWLDTLAIEPGQTQRIAFAAEHAGRWLIESVATDWAAPRFVRWYAVE